LYSGSHIIGTIYMWKNILIIFFVLNILYVGDNKTVKGPVRPSKAYVDTLFAKLKSRMFTESTVPLLDSIINEGKLVHYYKRVKDVYELRNRYYWQNLDAMNEKKMISAAHEMMNFGESIHDNYTYFEGWNGLINYYIGHELFVKGILEIEKFKQETIRRKLPLYEAYCYKNLGNLFYMQADYETAIQNYMIGIELSKKANDMNNVAYNYLQSGIAYVWMKKYKEAINCYNKSVESAVGPGKENTIIMTKILIGLCRYYLGEYDEMSKLYNDIKKYRFLDQFLLSSVRELKAYNCIVNKEYDKALLCADSIAYTLNQCLVRTSVYALRGEKKKQADTLCKMVQAQVYVFPSDDKTRKQLKKSLYEITKIGQDSLLLKKENEHLRLRNELLNSTLQKNHWMATATRKDMEINASKSHISQIKLQARLEAIHHSALMDKLANQQQSYKIKQLSYIFILSVACFFICWLVYLSHINKRHNLKLKAERDAIISLKKTDDELNEMAQKAKLEAEDSDRLKNQFIEHISHAIRTPLNAIVGFSDMLTNEEIEGDEEEKQRLKNIIELNSQQLSGVVNSVLDLTNIQKGKYKMIYSPTTTEELCSITFLAEKKNLAKEVDMTYVVADNCKNMTLYTDVHRVSQALRCLINNACKFTEKGTICMFCDQLVENDVPSIRFIVTDTGIGIPKEKMKDIFSPFIKLDEFSKGYGLGLSFCAEIARRLNGDCWIDTEYKSGSCFIFTIPLLLEEPVKEGGNV